MRKGDTVFSEGSSGCRIPGGDASTIGFFGSPREIGRKWGALNRKLILRDVSRNYLKQAAAHAITDDALLERSKDFVRIAGKIAPHWLEEASSVALGAGVDEDMYISFISGIYRSLFMHECTSYAVSPEYTLNKAIFFHKNRDSQKKEQVAFVMTGNVPGVNKFIATSDAAVITCMMMVNEKGLAGSADCPNEGTPLPEEAAPRYRGVMNTFILRHIAERASDCAEALEIIREFVGKKYYAGGDINVTHWLFVDRRGTILEISNNSSHVISKIHGEKVFFSRLDNSRAARRLRDADVPVDFRLFHGVSRDPSICLGSSVSGMTVEIDRDFPSAFTCAWLSLPAHSVSFPMLMGGRETFLPLANGEAYRLAKRCKRRVCRELGVSVENGIHGSKALLKEKLRKDAGAIDLWTNEQSAKVMSVLQAISAGRNVNQGGA